MTDKQIHEVQEILTDVFKRGREINARDNLVKDGEFIGLCTEQIFEVVSDSTKKDKECI